MERIPFTVLQNGQKPFHEFVILKGWTKPTSDKKSLYRLSYLNPTLTQTLTLNTNPNPNHDHQLLKNAIQLLIFEPNTQLAMTQHFIYSFSNPKPNSKPYVNSILSLCFTKIII